MVCGITFAASGAPLPFLPKPQTTSITLAAPLPPADAGSGHTTAQAIELALAGFNPD